MITSGKHLNIGGMTCMACQARIEKALGSADGVVSATVSYTEGYANVRYNADVINLDKITQIIERTGYEVLPAHELNVRRIAGLIIIIAALYFLISRLNLSSTLPLAEEGTAYGMLFVIGLLTSLHCVAMCGGINLSQCIPQTSGSPLRASSLYNLGRVLSYTAVGFVVGGIGGVITPDGVFRGAVQIVAGVFMVIMGVNMLGIFPWLRKLVPHMPAFISRKVDAEKGRSKSPIIVGLLNGLMPCGPLQAMQLYALSTGSPVQGAVSMLIFSLGTVPLMFGLGALTSLLSKKFTQKVVMIGSVFITVLGLTMFTQGATLSGFFVGVPGGFSAEVASHVTAVNEDTNGAIASANGSTSGTDSAEGGAEVAGGTDGASVSGDVQFVSSTLEPGSYPKLTVQEGIPVKWTINAPDGSINGCNKSIYIPEYDIEYAFKPGENVIEFTPDRQGDFQYSCWMGMIQGMITVVGADSA